MFCFELQSVNSQSKIDSLLIELQNTRDNSERVKQMVRISLEYSNTNPLSAFEYAEKAVEIAETTTNSYLILQSLANAGNLFYQHGILLEASKYHSQYLEKVKNEDNLFYLAIGYTNMGNVGLTAGELDFAKKNFRESIQIYDDLRKKHGVIDLHLTEISTAYNNLGLAYLEDDLPDEALVYFNKGINEAHGAFGTERILANLYTNSGKALGLLEQHQLALEQFNIAYDIFKSVEDKNGLMGTFLHRGEYFIMLNQPEIALENLYKGFSISRDLNNVYYLMEFSELLYNFYNDENQIDSAFKYIQLHQVYLKEFNKEKTLKEITRLELNAKFQEREAIRLLEEKKRTLWNTFIGVTLIMILIIVGLLYFLSQNRVRRLNLLNKAISLESRNTQLKQEKLEKELELRNKELTTNVMNMIRKNEIINDVTRQLIDYSKVSDNKNLRIIRQVVNNLNRSKDDSIWNEFEIRFQSVHNKFYTNLQQKFPRLSLNERRLCAFLRLDMTTKEISSITGQSVKSIEMARIRLRKKLDICNTDSNLNEFLQLI